MSPFPRSPGSCLTFLFSGQHKPQESLLLQLVLDDNIIEMILSSPCLPDGHEANCLTPALNMLCSKRTDHKPDTPGSCSADSIL